MKTFACAISLLTVQQLNLNNDTVVIAIPLSNEISASSFEINHCRTLLCGPALKDLSKLMFDFHCLFYL